MFGDDHVADARVMESDAVTRARAWAGAVPPKVWTAVAGLVLLASVGLALVVGAGLSVWQGGFGSSAHGPAVVVSPPSSGVVVVPPSPAAPRVPGPVAAPVVPPAVVRVPAVAPPSAPAPVVAAPAPPVVVATPPVVTVPRVPRVPMVVIRVPTGQLRQVTEIRQLLSRLRAVLVRSIEPTTAVVPVATRTHDETSQLASRSAAVGAHESRVTSRGTDADNDADNGADNGEQRSRADLHVRTSPRSDYTGRHRIEADRDGGFGHYRTQHGRGHGRHG